MMDSAPPATSPAARTSFARRTDLPFGRRAVLAIAAGLFLLALLRGIIWAGVVPVWQTPDEPDHMVYVERLAQQGTFRIGDSSFSQALQSSIVETGAGAMFHHTLVRSDIGPLEAARARSAIDGFSATAGTDQFSRAARYPPLYYWLQAQVQRVLPEHTYLVGPLVARLVSSLMTAIGVVFVYLMFRDLFRDEVLAWSGGAVFALLPMLGFTGMAINSDVLVAMLVAAYCFLAVRQIRGGLSWRLTLATSLVLGAGLLSKQSFAIVAVTYPALLAFLAFRYRGGRAWSRTALHGAAGGTLAVALAGWFYFPALAAAATAPEPGLSFTEYLRWAAQNRYGNILSEWWGVYGWLDAPMPQAVYAALRVVTAAAVIGVFIGAIRALRSRRWDPALVFLAGAVLLWPIALTYLEYPRVRDGLDAFGFVQGRYYVPIAPALVALGLHGVAGWLPSLLARRAVAVLAVMGAALLQVIALSEAVVPRYFL